jgi:hypothetical protein
MVASLLRLAGLDWARAGLFHAVPQARDLGHLGPLSPRRWPSEPAGRQHRDQIPRRWRMAGSQARGARPTPMAQGPSGHGPGHIRHLRGGIHPQPRRRQPRVARSARPDPEGRPDRHDHRRRRLRHTPLPQCHHRTRRRFDHPVPRERTSFEKRQPSCTRPQRHPARHAILRAGVLETLDRIPRPQPDRGEPSH